MNGQAHDDGDLDSYDAVAAAARQFLALSPLADPVELLRGQTLTTENGARYAVHDAAVVEGRLTLRIVPLRPATLTITVTQAPTSAEPADLHPPAPTPADVAARLRQTPARLESSGRPVAVATVRLREGYWEVRCDEHGRVTVRSDYSVARRAALAHAQVVHDCSSSDEEGQG